MNQKQKFIYAVIGITTGLLSACGETETETANPSLIDNRSAIQFGACPIQINDVSAICGTLTVAENREKKDSRLIGLPFVILPAKTSPAVADPVVLYTGGPGPSPLRTIEAVPAADIAQYPPRQNRDLIVLNHRGTDLTINGTLDCPEVVLDFAAGERYTSVTAASDRATICKKRLQAAYPNIEFEQYSTKNIARDHEDLRILLGKQRGFTTWNVLGSSYGSLLAQQTLKDFPTSVRSVVFDGPFPIQSNTFFAPDILEAVSQVFAQCRTTSSCASQYGEQLPAFAAAIERLETAPIMVDGTAVSGHAILNALRRELPPIFAPYGKVPLFVDKVIRGDLEGANAIFQFVGFPEIAISPDTAFFTISCTDADGESSRISDTPKGAEAWPLRVRQIASFYQSFPAADLCSVWIKPIVPSAAGKAAVNSTVPALITVGQFDIATPATNADILLKTNANAQKVVFVGRGHSLAEGDVCMLTIAAAFIDTPTKKVDTSCIDAASTLSFE